MQVRESLRVFLLDQLVVCTFPAEGRGELLLDNPHEVRVNKGHSFAGQLFIAADVAETGIETELSEAAIMKS